ncbi:uncharacterized protein [Montipora capricornis]|uniref:uncharacterized protein isoform X3 n=1 Tax=Montipora capricornis TaxID=246305 RepID=UPI0035F212E4
MFESLCGKNPNKSINFLVVQGDTLTRLVCSKYLIMALHLSRTIQEDGTASSSRTCSSDALSGKRKRLGLPFFFSAITIKCHKTLLTWDKRLSKYRQRLA